MKVSEDFKMVIILDEDLPVGLKANTAAILSLTLGNRIEGLIGPDLLDGEGNTHAGLTGIPLPVLKSTGSQLRAAYEQAYQLRSEILFVDVTDAAQTTKNYQDYEEKLKGVHANQLKLLGIAIAGPKKLINKLSGSLGLLR